MVELQKKYQIGLRRFGVVNWVGFKSLYIGTVPTIIKQSTSVGIRFWLYNVLKDKLMDLDKNISSIKTLCIGFIAGSCSTVLNHPFDVIKSNIQSNETQKKINIYKCSKQLIKENGVLSLFNGLNARFIRTGIAQGVTFVVYENFISLYKKYI